MAEDSDADDASYVDDDGDDDDVEEEEEGEPEVEDGNDAIEDDEMEDESVKGKPKLCSNVQTTSSSTVSSMDHS